MGYMIINTRVVLEEEVLEEAFVSWENGKITNYGSMDALVSKEDIVVFDGKFQTTVVPGMIDIHVHGAAGYDFMDATEEAVDQIATALAKEGVTSFLATTMTSPIHAIEHALTTLGNYQQQLHHPELVGIHLEGPFINVEQKGAQPSQSILKPSIELMERWLTLSCNRIKIVTLAPEIDHALDFISFLTTKGIISSIGHSNATATEINHALRRGASHFTHLFNGMKGLHHRDVGTVGAALLDETSYVELIADHHHFDLSLLPLVRKMKGVERMIAITDGMRAKGMPDGVYDLGGQEVQVGNGKCLLVHGQSLAGSVLTMDEARKNMKKYASLNLIETAKVTSLNSAQTLNLSSRKGSIEKGKDADLVVLYRQRVRATIARGELIYEENEEEEIWV